MLSLLHFLLVISSACMQLCEMRRRVHRNVGLELATWAINTSAQATYIQKGSNLLTLEHHSHKSTL